MKTITKKSLIKHDETNYPGNGGMMISRNWTDEETKEVSEFVAAHKAAAKEKSVKAQIQNIN